MTANASKVESGASLAEIAMAKPIFGAKETVIIRSGCKTYGSIAMNDERSVDQEVRVVIKAVHPPVYRQSQDAPTGYGQVSPAMISWLDSASQEVRYCLAEDAISTKSEAVSRAIPKPANLNVAGLCIFFLAGCLTAMAFSHGATASENSAVACPKIDGERLLSIAIKDGVTRCVYGRQFFGAGGSTRVVR